MIKTFGLVIVLIIVFLVIILSIDNYIQNIKRREEIEKTEKEIADLENRIEQLNSKILQKKQQLKDTLDQLDLNDPDSRELRDKILYSLERV